MGYRSLSDCVLDLERHGHLVRITEQVDPQLEMAAIHRRVFAAGGPAVYYERVKGCDFPAVSNLFGDVTRARFMFRDTLARVEALVRLKADPTSALRRPWEYLWAPLYGLLALPWRVRGGPVLAGRTSISALPQLKSWPDDGGAFVTLPEVYTEDPLRPGPMNSNLGMYRIQLSGGGYKRDEEVGLHYQLHRGIGVHHSAAENRGEPLRVSVFIGGPPAHMLAAVMPLPEGLSELTFAGALGRRRFRYARVGEHVVSTDADFCIVGKVNPGRTLPEGPFGDHLGYYSLQHDFPVLEVEAVHHRADAVWPFTIVGRPPQEDTAFGKLIHELTAPAVASEIRGVHALHAVDAAGVHPLMLALGSERYVPFGDRVPRELLTIANAILGYGQASLAKYLLIAAREDDDGLDPADIESFFSHVLSRFDPTRDLHFQTRTTIDTLDYSGTGLNAGSKLVIAAAGRPRRKLAAELPSDLWLPAGFKEAAVVLPGVMVIGAPAHERVPDAASALGSAWAERGDHGGFPLCVLVDDVEFASRNLSNFLWVTFTRSNPSHDVEGVGSFVEHKHWGCTGAVVIDARRKAHHAPPLLEDPAIEKRVDALGAPGRPLHGII